jgi:hypothetical protein
MNNGRRYIPTWSFVHKVAAAPPSLESFNWEEPVWDVLGDFWPIMFIDRENHYPYRMTPRMQYPDNLSP